MDVRSAEMFRYGHRVFLSIKHIVNSVCPSPNYDVREFMAVMYVLSLFEDEDIDV